MTTGRNKRMIMGLGLVVSLIVSGPGFAAMSYQREPFQQEATPSYARMVLNEDQFEGNWKQFKGELKKQWGDITDDDLLYIEGKMDKFEGKVQERYGDRKAEVQEWTEKWFDEHHHD